jgi:hypothetical protein
MPRKRIRVAEHHVGHLENVLAALEGNGDPGEIENLRKLIDAYRANGVERPKIRVSSTVLRFISGGQVWIDLHRTGQSRDEEQDPENVSMHRKLLASSLDRNGSIWVSLPRAELAALLVYAEAMQDAARDNIGLDEYALGEYNAATALIRKIHEEFAR